MAIVVVGGRVRGITVGRVSVLAYGCGLGQESIPSPERSLTKMGRESRDAEVERVEASEDDRDERMVMYAGGEVA